MAAQTQRSKPQAADETLVLREPTLADGAVLWQLASDSQSLDLNSPYAYLLWSDQFAETCVVAEIGGAPAGFVMGLRLPKQPDALFVWQVAVSEAFRGRRLASQMLDNLLERLPDVHAVEASVTPTNSASKSLFRSLARRHDCQCTEQAYIESGDFPVPGHEAETLFHIGPIGVNQ